MLLVLRHPFLLNGHRDQHHVEALRRRLRAGALWASLASREVGSTSTPFTAASDGYGSCFGADEGEFVILKYSRVIPPPTDTGGTRSDEWPWQGRVVCEQLRDVVSRPPGLVVVEHTCLPSAGAADQRQPRRKTGQGCLAMRPRIGHVNRQVRSFQWLG